MRNENRIFQLVFNIVGKQSLNFGAPISISEEIFVSSRINGDTVVSSLKKVLYCPVILKLRTNTMPIE